MMEMQLVAKIDQHISKEAWSALVPKIWEFCSRLDMGDEKNMIEEDDVLDEEDKTCLILQALPSAWKLKDDFLHFIQESDDFNRFIKKLSSESHLVATDTSDDARVSCD